MTPSRSDLKVSDILIVDPDLAIRPGGLVAVVLEDKDEVIVRRYNQLSVVGSAQHYELIPTNDNWATIQVDQ